ncbi:MAG: DegV family protein [Oscillibacter sp.]
MREFVILTDSCCDLTAEMAQALELEVLPLSLLMDGASYRNCLDGREIGFGEFYGKLRSGSTATTAAVSVGDFQAAMRAILESGRDVLSISFSSALSATYQSAAIAAEDLKAEFPQAKILVVDSLSASLGQGLLLYLCVAQKRAGRSIEEVWAFAQETRDHLCHWFTVDDLNHLKRGGRINAATALFGTMLSVKPVMHMDNGGHLVPVSKARGRKAALLALVDRMEATALDAVHGTVFISHGDCEGDALTVAEEIARRFGNRDVHINYVGPVIGNHSGPGTVALFFVGTVR